MGYTGVVHSQVYKSVAPDGSISYSDGPSTPTQAPENITPLPVYIAPKITANPSPPADKPKPKAATSYQAIRIVSPAPDAGIWDNSGTISVQVETEPTLNTEAGDRVVVYVDGKQSGDPAASTSASATGIERGTHQISAAIVSSTGGTALQSEPITIHLHKHSVHTPARRGN